jgi:hypothetical protein
MNSSASLPASDPKTFDHLLSGMDFSGFHFKKIYQPEHLPLRDAQGWSLLHHAVHNGSVGSVAAMLPDAGSLVNALDSEGWSPAMLAASNADAAALRQLSPWIDHALTAPGGRTLAMLCAADADSLREVIDACDPRALDDKGQSLLDHSRSAFESGTPDKACLALIEERLFASLCPTPSSHPRSRL